MKFLKAHVIPIDIYSSASWIWRKQQGMEESDSLASEEV